MHLALLTLMIAAAPVAAAPGDVVGEQAPATSGRAPGNAPERAHANRLLQSGNAALEQGAFDAAIRDYEAAYRIFPSPKVLYNLARAYQAAGRLPDACDTFERFISGVAHGPAELQDELADRVAAAKADVASLTAQLATVSLTLSPHDAVLTIDGRVHAHPATDRPIVLRLSPGPHPLVATRQGFAAERRDLLLETGRAISLALNLRPEHPDKPLLLSGGLTARSPEPTELRSSTGRSRAVWWGALVAGSVLVASGTAVLLTRRDAPCPSSAGFCF